MGRHPPLSLRSRAPFASRKGRTTGMDVPSAEALACASMTGVCGGLTRCGSDPGVLPCDDDQECWDDAGVIEAGVLGYGFV